MARHAPKQLGAHGKRLWTAVERDFELDEHELALLKQACLVCDLLETLQKAVDEEGPFIDGRITDTVREMRQQRIVLARLLAALRVPSGVEGDLQAGARERRPPRGVYGGTPAKRRDLKIVPPDGGEPA
jgi:hypothetical protein